MSDDIELDRKLSELTPHERLVYMILQQTAEDANNEKLRLHERRRAVKFLQSDMAVRCCQFFDPPLPVNIYLDLADQLETRLDDYEKQIIRNRTVVRTGKSRSKNPRDV